MIFNFPNVKFSDDEWIYIIAKYLNGWTEISLTENQGYNIEEVKFYDAILGTLLKHTEFIMAKCPTEINKDFVNSWKYQGKIYRVLHKCPKSNKSRKYELPHVDYHGLIAHWTKDYTFSGLMYKLSPDIEYIILEADTKTRLAFDVNSFRNKYKCRKTCTKKEQEIIFPMYKENIKVYQMTINEFIKKKQEECCDR